VFGGTSAGGPSDIGRPALRDRTCGGEPPPPKPASGRRYCNATLLLFLFLAATNAFPASRPHYGGVLRVEIPLSTPLAADESGPAPFTDHIEYTGGRTDSEKVTDLELGRADIIEIGPESLRRAGSLRTAISQPAELIAIRVQADKPALQDVRLRQAISLSVDRSAINNVALQKHGEIAGGLLPNWLTGYAFLFSPKRDLGRAQQLGKEAGNVLPLTIAVSEPEPMLQLIADRVALNAHDAGLTIQASADPQKADLVVDRVALAAVDPGTALGAMCGHFGAERPDAAAQGPQKLYEAERAVVDQAFVIPLVFVSRIYAFGPRVRNWSMTPDGHLRLADVWLAPEAGK
jgi:hypothetical protein